MNNVSLIGRLTKEPEITYLTGENPIAVATFNIAIDRPGKSGQDKKTDFPRIIVFGRQAENCEKFLAKGMRVGVQGSIQTGSYTNREGATVYTTDVVANRVEFLEWRDKSQMTSESIEKNKKPDYKDKEIPEGFQAITDDDIPF